MFDEILKRVGPRIQKKDTNLRKCLDPGLKLAITIRHLASGDKYRTLQYDFRVARNTICIIIPEVCRAIFLEYKNELIPCPSSPEEWNPIAEEFQRKWNLPHACGALDGKHVAIRCPARTGLIVSQLQRLLLFLTDGSGRCSSVAYKSCGLIVEVLVPCPMPKSSMSQN